MTGLVLKGIPAWLTALCLLPFPSSCGKEGGSEPASPDNGDGPQSLLVIGSTASINSSSTIETKAAVHEATPQTFGLFIYEEGTVGTTQSLYHPYYKNIVAKRRSNQSYYSRWTFQYEGYKTEFTNLYIIQQKDNAGNPLKADVFAYAPYLNQMSDLTHIPYSISSQNDIMWAIQNKDDYDFTADVETNHPYDENNVLMTDKFILNKGIEVDTETKYLRFDFKHLLSLVQFRFKIKNDTHPYAPDGYSGNTSYSLTSIRLTPNKDNPKALAESGTFNALTGILTMDSYRSNPISFNAPSGGLGIPTTGSYSTPFDILVAPTGEYETTSGGDAIWRSDYKDGDLSLDFTIKSHEFGTLPYGSYTIKREQLSYEEDGVTKTGLKPGYKYVFYFTLDNYIHLDHVKTSTWDEQEIPDFII